MKIVALLTGRGNSTLKDKNVLNINGKPVLYYSANAARKSSLITGFYCSSDDDKILNAAEVLGFQPIKRPVELAKSDSQHVDAINHAISIITEYKELPDVLVVLLANNVTVKPNWIDDCVNILINDPSISAVVPVYEDNDHHPLRAKKLNSEGELIMYEDTAPLHLSTNRQDLPKCFFLAHNFWILNVKSLLRHETGQPPWNFMGNRVIPYFIPESIDIHDELDLCRAEQWVISNYFY